MFDPTSRYHQLDEATVEATDAEGNTTEIRYVTRRFIVDDDSPPVAERQVEPGERVDRLSARLLGDPRLFWRLADGNRVLRPTELTDEPGRWVVVHVPSLGGR
jgi:hypothetical protein